MVTLLKINITKMVDGISLFLSPKEREYCKHVCDDSVFLPGVPVQGLFNVSLSPFVHRTELISKYQNKLDDEAMIQSLSPVMVIDVDTCIIYESLPYQIYKLIRRDYLIKDIELVVSPRGPSNLWTIRYIPLLPLKSNLTDFFMKERDAV